MGGLLTLRLIDNSNHEEERILSAIAGDPEARAWVVDHYSPAIYRYCHRMTRNSQDAAELTQEILLRALKALRGYDPQRSFKTWIFSIARNACIDSHRKRKPSVSDESIPLISAMESAEEATERAIRAKRVHQALSELPDLYREVLVLYHFEHFKYQEIAETLDLPLGTVMNRIFRARQKLRVVLESSP